MTTDQSPPKATSVGSVMTAAGPGSARHSTLYLWMRANRAAFARELDQRGANWLGLVAVFAEKGLLAANSQPATVKVAQQTWRRVKATMKPKATKPTAEAPAPELTPQQTGPAPVVRSGIFAPEPDYYEGPTFKHASLKGVPKPK